MKRASWLALVVIVAQGAVSTAYAEGWDPDTRATNLVADGIAGTRHNMTMSYVADAGAPEVVEFMDIVRNNYGEVCVYCHTPHGANNSSGAGMPLWNRTVNTSLAYTLYNESADSAPIPTTLQLAGEQTITHPGPASLTCLSCHDGVTAIDSVINMPGSGGYRAAQETSVDTGFLSGWDPSATVHYGLATCASQCHNRGDNPTDFQNFVIGAGTGPDGQYVEQAGNVVDLSDDHPVGVLYPTALTSQTWVDFREMNVEIPGRYAFFDDGNGRADKDEIRVYDSGDGFEVECASCHDPHGVPDATNISFIPSFLRVSNADSTLCLACHVK